MINTLIDRKQKPPKWFFDCPELLPGQSFYIDSFDRLTTCRSIGSGGVGRIPWTSLWEYAQAHSITTHEDFAVFEAIMERMDIYYVGWVSDHMNKE